MDLCGSLAGFHALFYGRDVLGRRTLDPRAIHREHDLNAVAVLAVAPANSVLLLPLPQALQSSDN